MEEEVLVGVDAVGHFESHIQSEVSTPFARPSLTP
jgi:hypothetical protein